MQAAIGWMGGYGISYQLRARIWHGRLRFIILSRRNVCWRGEVLEDKLVIYCYVGDIRFAQLTCVHHTMIPRQNVLAIVTWLTSDRAQPLLCDTLRTQRPAQVVSSSNHQLSSYHEPTDGKQYKIHVCALGADGGMTNNSSCEAEACPQRNRGEACICLPHFPTMHEVVP